MIDKNMSQVQRMSHSSVAVSAAASPSRLVDSNSARYCLNDARPGVIVRRSGFECEREAREVSPQTVRVLLPGHCSDEAVVIPAVNQGGVFRLLSKPWEDEEIRDAVVDALGMKPEAWKQRRERVQGRLRSARQSDEAQDTPR